MGKKLLNKIKVKPLKIINLSTGNIMRAIIKKDLKNGIFGEAYFSWVKPGVIKAWKFHRQMTLNLVVPVGEVKFVFHEPHSGKFREELLGEIHYQRLTVPPRVWFGFQGCASVPSLLLNVSDIPHDPEEVETKELNEFPFQFKKVAGMDDLKQMIQAKLKDCAFLVLSFERFV